MSQQTDVTTGNTYDKYSSRHPIERSMMARFLRCFDQAVGSEEPESIVEVGMGEGEIASRLAAQFPSASLVGIDLYDPDLVAFWRDRGLRGVVADACLLPFADRSADLVLAIEVLEHVPDPGKALSEIARVARGKVILSVPLEPLWRIGNIARRRYLRDWGNTPGHVNHFSRRGFTGLVARHLEVAEVHQPLPWTLVVARARR